MLACGLLVVCLTSARLCFCRPADCFFVLQLGPYWAVSSTQHSSGRPLWRWQLQLPVTDPAAVLSLALYKREDQKEGKKVSGQG